MRLGPIEIRRHRRDGPVTVFGFAPHDVATALTQLELHRRDIGMPNLVHGRKPHLCVGDIGMLARADLVIAVKDGQCKVVKRR